MPFEVRFDKKSNTQYFDLDEIPVELIPKEDQDRLKNLTFKDKINKQILAYRGVKDF